MFYAVGGLPKKGGEGRYPGPSTATRWRPTRSSGCGPSLPTHSGEIQLRSAGGGDTVDLTDAVERIVAQSGVGHGLVSVCVPGSTAATTTMDVERHGIYAYTPALD